MKYEVNLECEIPKTFRIIKACQSVDLDVDKKSKHNLNIDCDLSNYKIGLILGASGSGKTTLAKQMFGNDCFKTYLDESKPVIEQFPENYEFEDCVKS